MQRTAFKQVVRWIVVGGAFGAATATAWAGAFVGEPTTTRYAPQVALYVSQSFWSGGTSRLRWGMRIEEIGGTSIAPSTDAPVDTLRPRELIELQLARSSEPVIVVGQRLTWNLARGTLSMRSSSAAPGSVAAIDGFELADRWHLPRWDARASNPGRPVMALVREPRPSIFVFDTRRVSLVALEFPRWHDQRCCTIGGRSVVGNMLAAHADGSLRAAKGVEFGRRSETESLAQARFDRVPGLFIVSLK